MPTGRSTETPRGRVWPIVLLLSIVATGLAAQDGRWNYRPDNGEITDIRDDTIWTDAIAPARPAYRMEVLCDGTEYISFFVRSDTEIAPVNILRVRFDGGAEERLPVQNSLATSTAFTFEPAGPALRRILASKSMAMALSNTDLQEVIVEFEVSGLKAAVKQMPQGCQQRFAELAAVGKTTP